MVFGKQEEGGAQGTGQSHFTVSVTATTAEGFKAAVKELQHIVGGNPDGEEDNGNGNGEEPEPEREVA
jgi:hypothetical protein